MAIDTLDARLIELLAREPRIGVLEASRRLGVARGTAQARLEKLRTRGVIRGFGPEVDPAAIGFPVTAFVTLEITQGVGEQLRVHLRRVPEVLELHTITGQGDLLCRLVARSNEDLQRVIDEVVCFPGIVRSSTVIALSNPVPLRLIPLVRHAAAGSAGGLPGAVVPGDVGTLAPVGEVDAGVGEGDTVPGPAEAEEPDQVGEVGEPGQVGQSRRPQRPLC
ncbi:DNA-binding transcriptional regulator, Lrp family [Streptomyces zhaozhouensis]|uniref:DNA-binding transcriptional regulator, Lrp family n=1 Tax=Streptomyces zhaozhouensis TaxID=1300267 RepID=A0A286E284_9ACTN|nr:DNA-binding transcriptional regulator, Lrp family [Streptomyces zhaozhouensis]